MCLCTVVPPRSLRVLPAGKFGVELALAASGHTLRLRQE